MNVEWEFTLIYKARPYKLKAVVEYISKQILRIRVYGTKKSLLLQTNYSEIYFRKSQRGAIRWYIKEGAFTEGTPESTRLWIDIYTRLEYLLKKDIKKIFPDENTLFDGN